MDNYDYDSSVDQFGYRRFPRRRYGYRRPYRRFGPGFGYGPRYGPGFGYWGPGYLFRLFF